MKTIEEFDEVIKLLFNNDQEIRHLIINSDNINDFLDIIDTISMDQIVSFINKYRTSLIDHFMKDELFKNELLKDGIYIYRNKIDKINEDYLEKLIININKREYTKDEIILLLEVISIINLNGLELNENILKNDIYLTIKNIDLVSDGDRILNINEKRSKTDTLLRWVNVFGNSIVQNVFNIDTLNERVLELLSIDTNYENELNEILNSINVAKKFISEDIIPTEEEINKVNNMFNMYEEINRKLIVGAISTDKFYLLHFVQSNDVNYVLTDEGIIDINQQEETKEAEFNKEKNDSFIASYINNINVSLMDQGIMPDITDPEYRRIISEYLEEFNRVLNTSPLERIPIDVDEVKDYKHIIRPASPRLSCSISRLDNIKPHLDRSIALVIKPRETSSILTTSYGYSTRKDYKSFKDDSVSYVGLKETMDNEKQVNETVVDSTKCNCIGVIVLSNDPVVLKRAENIANNYKVNLYNLSEERKQSL